jgi:23S rRNA (adenine2503-C2)-methyltransferase
MKLIDSRSFKNGNVYALKLADGMMIETTDTFLPYYTKDCINEHTNQLKDGDLGSRKERWMIGVSCMSGCPCRCKFCATGSMPKWRNLTADEIVDQVMFAVNRGDSNPSPLMAKEFKINYTRMGEPFLNIEAVRLAVTIIEQLWPGTHHYISTIGIKDSDFSWIWGNVTLQVSLHSCNDERRNELIPFPRKMTIPELGAIRTRSNLKTTLNMTLVDDNDFDIGVLKEHFHREHFFVKLSPINTNEFSEHNGLGNGAIEAVNIL